MTEEKPAEETPAEDLGDGEEVTDEAKEAAAAPAEPVEGAEDLPEDVPSDPIEEDEA